MTYGTTTYWRRRVEQLARANAALQEHNEQAHRHITSLEAARPTRDPQHYQQERFTAHMDQIHRERLDKFRRATIMALYDGDRALEQTGDPHRTYQAVRDAILRANTHAHPPSAHEATQAAHNDLPQETPHA